MTSARALAGLSLGLLFIAAPVFADTLSVSVSVPDHCTVVDTDSVSHTYSGGYFGVCALQTAIDSSSISGALYSNAFPAFGLFVTSVGGVAANPSSQYWALYQNGSFANFGLTQLPVAVGDTVSLELHNFSDEFLGTRFTLNITSLTGSASASPTTSGGKMPELPIFSVPNALSFLREKQQTPGGFGSDMLTDWTAIALASSEQTSMLDAIKRYLILHVPTLVSVTDYERHAMALEALGIDPYSGTSIDYISPILAAFDGTQIGDPVLINDDIFALIALPKAGYGTSDDVIQRTLAFVVSHQHANGSWEESVDLTGAAIQALRPFIASAAASTSIAKAREYLKAEQNTTAGWGNSFSTSWALHGIAALGESPSRWTKGRYSPLNFLGLAQLPDGGVEPVSKGDDTRIWATAYAIPAALGKPWSSILQSFPKPTARPQIEVQTSAPAATTTPLTQPTSSPIASIVEPGPTPETNSQTEMMETKVATLEVAATETLQTETATPAREAEVAAAAGAAPTFDWSFALWLFGLLLILYLTYFFIYSR